MHQCPICPKSFPSLYKLQRHHIIHTGQKPFICKICGKAFTESEHLKTHSEKIHYSRLLRDSFQDGISTNNQMVLQLNHDKPTAVMNTHGSGNCTIIPSTVSSSVASQPEWKGEIMTHKCFLPSAENGNPPKNMPHVNDGSVMSSDSDVMDPKHQKQVDSANADTSVCNHHSGYTCKVCLKSFTSSLQLWIHSPTHNKPKQSERGMSGQTFCKNAHSKMSQELSSSRRKITFKHQCPKCLKTFCSPSKLQRHLLIHTGQKPYSCMICCKAFRQKVHLKSHLSTSNKCSLSANNAGKKQRLCNGSQTSDLQLQSSLQQPTSHQAPVNSAVELELQCKISVNAMQAPSKTEIKSGAVGESEQLLNTSSQSMCQKSGEQEQQYMTHKDLKSFRCMICNRSFRLEVNLIRHHRIHREQKELAAPAQDMGNNVKRSHSEAIKHSSETNNADPIDLNVIVKPETWSENLSDLNESPQDAELITSAEQQSETCQAAGKKQRTNTSHQCHACSKCFPSSSKLQRHIMTHTGQRPFGCEMCGKRFRQKTHLRVHCRTHLWSRYHKQRSLYINRPPSRIGGFYTRTAGDIPIQEMFTHKRDFETHNGSDLISAKQLDQTLSMAIVQTHDNREWEDKVLLHTSKRNEVVHLSKVPKVLPSADNRNPPKNMLHVNDGSLMSSESDVMDPKYQRQVDSANADTSVCKTQNRYTCKVCLKSFTSSLQLWIHSPTHNKPKQSERGISGQTFSEKAQLKMSQELSSSRRKITLKHQCPKCLKTFCSPSKLQRHLLIHTGQKPYSCMICCKAFRQKVHLKSHLSTSNKCSLSANNAGKKQSLCNGSQTSDLQLQSSLQQPTSHQAPVNSAVELELQCKISVNAVQAPSKTEIKSGAVGEPEQLLNTSSQSMCQKSGEQEQQYMTHKDLKPFRCMICNRSFRLEVNLIRHHRIHRNQKELAAPAQDMGNNVKRSHSDAIKHSSEAINADPIDLNVIVKPETWSENLSDLNESPQDAELITSAERQSETCQATSKKQRTNTSHQCHACSKCFPSSSKLQRHIMTHTGQRPFGCEMCGKRFRQKTHLRVHCRTHLWSRYHKQRSLYINRPPSRIGGFYTRTAGDIPIQEMFTHKRDFETHNGSDLISAKQLDQTPSMAIVQTHENREWKDKILLHTSKKNEVVHPSKVPKVTVKKTQSAKSKQNTDNVKHKCFQCFKCFPSASKLQRHEMVHTGLKPFQCHMCGKAFRQASHLKTHERFHCKSKPSKPVDQQGNIRKFKANSQQELYPRISVGIPPQKKSVNINTAHSIVDGAVSNGESELVSTRHEISITKVNRIIKKRTKSNVICKKRKLHMCRICLKNFASPYKLSRHLLIHSGIRPYKCTLCSKTFTQCNHLKVHECRCRHGNRNSDYYQREMTNTNHLQDKCIENLTDYTDFNVGAARGQPESHYTSVGHFTLTDREFSDCIEAIDSEWLAVPEVSLQEANNESNEQLTENCNQATDHYSYSFPSELAFEINKLVQNENMGGSPLSHQYEGNNVEIPGQFREALAMSDSNNQLSDECVSSVAANQIQADLPDYYWCEPVGVFEDDNCTVSFKSKKDLQEHNCNTSVEPKMTVSTQKYCCDICFKYFVSPSKLKRHYLIHTGQRPFRCDICGKTFTQSAHVRTHRLIH
ncbi:zinc finger protein 91 [Thunnus albacares]|uniref:zinc finger protein 91 n=1 Tax=Thunnus albacares TaxID=8236 RepID=UPI001CF679DD|nr:zinc finger protein 91 [Thunnus albacares]XP_044231776.1 zinc finger protein 91 [Thunnus albacares]